jgi:hypothetical protein
MKTTITQAQRKNLLERIQTATRERAPNYGDVPSAKLPPKPGAIANAEAEIKRLRKLVKRYEAQCERARDKVRKRIQKRSAELRSAALFWERAPSELDLQVRRFERSGR